MFKRVLVLLLLAGSVNPSADVAVAGPAKTPSAQDVRKAFYRCWLEVEAVEAGTRTTDLADLCGHEFAPEVWYVWGRKGELAPGPGSPGVRIDPVSDPMRLELLGGTYGQPRKDPVVQPGIFKFEKDKLVIALGPWVKERVWEVGQDYPERPKDFRSTKEKPTRLLYLVPCRKYDQ
jgi:hypothetical protein